MNSKVKLPYVVLLLTLVLIIAVLSILLYWKSSSNANDLYDNLLWGVVCGLATYIITFYLTQKFLYSSNDQILERIEELTNVFPSHTITTEKILNVVLREYNTLVWYDRNSLLKTGFYTNVYKESNEIKVLGITLLKFIEALVSVSTTHIIIDQLLNDNNIKVEILLLNPDSKLVQLLDKQEETPNNPNPVSKKIQEALSILKKFSEVESDKRTKNENKLDIRLTDENITLTFSYVKKKKEIDTEDVLHLGLLFGQREGAPLFKFPKNLSDELYSDTIKYFDNLFDNAKSKQVFSWDNEGKYFANKLVK